MQKGWKQTMSGAPGAGGRGAVCARAACRGLQRLPAVGGPGSRGALRCWGAPGAARRGQARALRGELGLGSGWARPWASCGGGSNRGSGCIVPVRVPGSAAACCLRPLCSLRPACVCPAGWEAVGPGRRPLPLPCLRGSTG